MQFMLLQALLLLLLQQPTAWATVLRDPAAKEECAHHFTADRVSTREFPGTGDKGSVCVPSDVFEMYHTPLQPAGRKAVMEVPKTGSTTMKVWIQGWRVKRSPSQRNQEAFMVTRHPVKRFVSCMCTTLSRRRMAPLPLTMTGRQHNVTRHRCQDEAVNRIAVEKLQLAPLETPVSELIERRTGGFWPKDARSLIKVAKVITYMLQHPETEISCGHHRGKYWDRHCWSQSTFMFMSPCGREGLTKVTRAVRFDDGLEEGLLELKADPAWSQSIPSVQEKALPMNTANADFCASWTHNESFVPPPEIVQIARDFYSQDLACFGYA